jgi:hypothetical protein
MSRVDLAKKRNLPSQREIPRIQTNFFNASNSTILPDKLQCSPEITHFSSKLSENCKLTSLIEQQRFTDCIDLLEKSGYAGDSAVFVLAFLQGGVA